MKKIYTQICILLAGGMIAGGCNRYYYEKANIHYNNMAYSKAALCFEKIARDEKFPEVKTKLTDCYRLMNNKEKFEYWYKQLSQSASLPDSARLHYAKVLFDEGNYYEDSAAYEVKQLSINSTDASCFGASYYKDGIIFSAEMKQGMKSKKCDWTGRGYLDLYFSKIASDGSISTPEKIRGSVNRDYHEGPATANKKGNVLYFTSGLYAKKNKPGNNADGVNVIRIYRASRINGEWTEVKEVPLINNELFSVGHPALSPDEKKLYFISDMEGGQGGTDLYVSRWQEGAWGIPENLGPAVNSPGHEMFPFVADDGTLYYSSSGFGGLGGMDVFSSVALNGKWLSPKNMGYPINSSGDDISFIINAENKAGYFSSNRESPSGIDFLYSFFKPTPVFMVQGLARNIETKKPLASAAIELIRAEGDIQKVYTGDNGQFSFPLEKDLDYKIATKNKFSVDEASVSTKGKKRSETFNVTLELNDPVFNLIGMVVDKESGTPLTNVKVHLFGNDDRRELVTEEGGKFFFKLEPGANYNTYASMENYFTRSTVVSTVQKTRSEDVFIRLELERIVINKPIRVDNIHYDYNKWFIRDNAKPELDKLVKLMQDNPAIQIELSSHCDARGSDQHNMKLSQRRAETAVEYIVSRGIQRSRITAKGYGETRLLNRCANKITCAEEEHQLNRRTEFKVTGINQNIASKSQL